MKFHLFYLKKSPNDIYAWTTDLGSAKKFLEFRNPDCFIYETEKMDEVLSMMFMNKYSSKKLSEFIITDTNGDYLFLCTPDENELLTEEIESMDLIVTSIKVHFQENVHFKEEYREIIDMLTDFYIADEQQRTVVIDTVKLFYHLFNDTFIKDAIAHESFKEMKDFYLPW